jgi:hypothetical protein
MTQKAYFKDGHLLALGDVTEETASMADATFTVKNEIEAWRLSVDGDNKLVTAYDGEDKATALASLLADQEAAEAAIEAASSGDD